MSVKKLIALSAAGIASIGLSTVSLAGGPEPVAMPAQEPIFEPKVYIDAHVGYARVNWEEFGEDIFGSGDPFPFSSISSNGKGGFAGGVDLGYQFAENLALEAGWFYLPKAKGHTGGNNNGGDLDLRVSSWIAYIAAKLNVPIYERLEAFGKVGAVYRRLRWRDAGATALAGSTPITGGFGNENYWSPMFAAGFQYKWSGGWIASAQYMRIPGRLKTGNLSRRSPAVNLFTGAVGYEFAV